ncbi:cobaltochelatase subunit CobN [Coralliovum pocilloporae]|uniref:cobaltochelatase subunit CobN n=1 Tax=Coralliovum pocilloporae TaxID=3066369 RepID=UPI003307889F
MHILQAQGGRIDAGDEAVDLGQSPGDIVILSAADTELAGFSKVRTGMEDGFPSLRLANLMTLNHPFSVDLYADQTLSGAKLVFVRVLGGVNYWTYGIERLSELARGGAFKLAIVPGDDKVDPVLKTYSTLDDEATDALWSYCVHGGPNNLANALRRMAGLIGYPSNDDLPEPQPLDKAGIYWPGAGQVKLEDIQARWLQDAPVAVIIFYRALMQGGSLDPVDELVGALRDEGINALPLFVSSLKEDVSAGLVNGLFQALDPAVVLNSTGFALSKAGAEHQPTPLDATAAQVLQIVFSGTDREAWAESDRGLSIRDLAMNVVMPELDGKVLTRAVSFKEQGDLDPLTESRPVTYKPEPTRITFTAKLTANWAKLRHAEVDERRVALVLANYPNKDGRLANGVGLDTPASAVSILHALAENGYDTTGRPDDAKALMDRLMAGPTNALGERINGDAELSLDAYQVAFDALPVNVRDRMTERWGTPDADPFVVDGRFRLAIHRFGNAVVGIQPARGYNIDPKETYHSPDLVPPHNYFAFYIWLREQFGIHAIVHVGKHGNLEWLPGKAIALSDTCFPEAMLGPVPHLYPFIVNDPGEGTQAKRRTSAVIIDHLTPPMTRAEAHGPALELEALLDEYYLATGVDPRRVAYLRKEILNLSARHGLDLDCGIERDEDEDDQLQKIDAHLCDLKELQIRDGLHILGSSPDGVQRRDLLTAIARVPRPGDDPRHQSLQRAIALDLGLSIDPLDCEMAETYSGPKPEALASLDNSLWRSNGDTVERVEVLATALVSGDSEPDENWAATQAVLQEVQTRFAPSVDQSGRSEIEAVLSGLSGRFVPPGASGAPTRGRPEVLPTGKNFYSVDVRSVPTESAWALGRLSAERLAERYFQDEGDWPSSIALTAWGTSNMRTGGDDIAQALALIGAKPVWEAGSGRVTGFEVIPLSELKRPRIDVTLRISGFFRDAFPHQIDLFDSAVRMIAGLDEPDDANPIAARVKEERARLKAEGIEETAADKRAAFRVFGSMPGAYGAGLQALIDEKIWSDKSDFADAFLSWGGFAYGAGAEGDEARGLLEDRLKTVDAVVQNQDNREHDLLDSDDYYQFEGGLAATVSHLKGSAPKSYHNDHSRPERPVIRTLEEEIARVVRGRASNPKWIAGVMRHGYKGAFEMAATVDYLFAFSATTDAVKDHHYDQLFEAYLDDEEVRDFIARENPPALVEMTDRFLEAIDRDLWAPRRNSAYGLLMELKQGGIPNGA